LDPKLKPLEDLQKIDLSIVDLKSSGETFPKRLAELEKELQSSKSAWDLEEGKLADNDRQRKDLEQRLEDEKEKVKKWEARLTEQRTTREYSALAREIDIAKKANLTLIEDLATLARVREDIESVAMERREAYEAKQRTVGKEAEALKVRIAELDGRVGELVSKRTEETKLVAKELLQIYESVRKRRPAALVPVIDGTCTGCRMRIPPQQYNLLRSTMPFDQCRSCNRIIYAEATKA
jgi:hypothetical protein